MLGLFFEADYRGMLGRIFATSTEILRQQPHTPAERAQNDLSDRAAFWTEALRPGDAAGLPILSHTAAAGALSGERSVPEAHAEIDKALGRIGITPNVD